jgi:addiction module HigA family antidote
MFKNGMRPVHPGEVLQEDYLIPLGMSASALARALHVSTPRVNDIVRQRRGITADTALRLARHFGGDARSWLSLQAAYDLRIAQIKNSRRINREITPRAA